MITKSWKMTKKRHKMAANDAAASFVVVLRLFQSGGPIKEEWGSYICLDPRGPFSVAGLFHRHSFWREVFQSFT